MRKIIFSILLMIAAVVSVSAQTIVGDRGYFRDSIYVNGTWYKEFGTGGNNVIYVDTLFIRNDSLIYKKDGDEYRIFLPRVDTTSLSDRINKKLNISDTADKWQPKGNYLTNESDPIATAKTITINGTTKTIGSNPSFSITSGGTANDGTLTMSTSGVATGSATFTADQASNSTFTVNVPKTLSSYTNDPGFLIGTDTAYLSNRINVNSQAIKDTASAIRADFPSVSSIYTGDGGLSENRTVNGNAHDLNFDNTNLFITGQLNVQDSHVTLSDPNGYSFLANNDVDNFRNGASIGKIGGQEGNRSFLAQIYNNVFSIFRIKSNEAIGDNSDEIDTLFTIDNRNGKHDIILPHLKNNGDSVLVTDENGVIHQKKLNLSGAANDAKITIKNGSSTLGDFTVNQSADKSIDISPAIPDVSGLMQNDRTITINGTTKNVSDNPSFTISGGGSGTDTATIVDRTMTKTISGNTIKLGVDTSLVATHNSVKDTLTAHALSVLAPNFLNENGLGTDTSRAYGAVATNWYVDSSLADFNPGINENLQEVTNNGATTDKEVTISNNLNANSLMLRDVQYWGRVYYSSNDRDFTIVTDVSETSATHHVGILIRGGSPHGNGAIYNSTILLRSKDGEVTDLNAYGSDKVENVSAYFYNGYLQITFTITGTYLNVYFGLFAGYPTAGRSAMITNVQPDTPEPETGITGEKTTGVVEALYANDNITLLNNNAGYVPENSFNKPTHDTVIQISGNGKILGNANFHINPNVWVLPKPKDSVASTISLKAGDNITITGDETQNIFDNPSWTINSTGGGGGSYTLPTASSSTLGGIKVGDGLNIDGSGKLSVGYTSESSTGKFLATPPYPASGSPVFRAIESVDLPDVPISKLTQPTPSTYILPTFLGPGVHDNTTVLHGDGTWEKLPPPVINQFDSVQTANMRISGKAVADYMYADKVESGTWFNGPWGILDSLDVSKRTTIGGALRVHVTGVASDYTVGSYDYILVVTGNDVTVTMPAAGNGVNGSMRKVIIKNESSTDVTISPTGSDTVETGTLSIGEAVTLVGWNNKWITLNWDYTGPLSQPSE